jgi:hypothetical protein
MKSYRLAIAGAPERIAVRFRRDITKYRINKVLSHVLDRHPALASGSGTCPISLYRFEIAYQHRPGTRSVAMRRGGGTGGSNAT